MKQRIDVPAAFQDIQREWEAYYPPSPIYEKTLFHYTTGHGLEGITKSKSLWASAARYSNDLSEVRYACDLALPVIDEMMLEFKGNDHRRFFDVLRLCFSTPEWADQDAFMVSFCETADLLSQWRGYGPGNGYAIGFDLVKERAVQMTTTQRIRLLLRQVDYELESQKKSLTKFLHNGGSLLSKMLTAYKSDEVLPIVLARVRYSLAEWMYTIKHPTFNQEHEWKLLAIPPKAINNFPGFLEFGDAYDSYAGINARVVGNRMVPI